MRVSASMESLWRYIESLSLSERNRQWLAGKLLEWPESYLRILIRSIRWENRRRSISAKRKFLRK